MINEEYYYSCKYLVKDLSPSGVMYTNINIVDRDRAIKLVENVTKKDFLEIIEKLKELQIINSEKEWQNIAFNGYRANKSHIKRIENCNETNKKEREKIKKDLNVSVEIGSFLVEGMTLKNIIQYEEEKLLGSNALYNENSLLSLLRNESADILYHVLKDKNKNESMKMLFTVISGMAKYNIFPASYEEDLFSFLSDSVSLMQKIYGNENMLKNIKDLGFYPESPYLYSVLGHDTHSINEIKKIFTTIIEKTELIDNVTIDNVNEKNLAHKKRL